MLRLIDIVGVTGSSPVAPIRREGRNPKGLRPLSFSLALLTAAKIQPTYSQSGPYQFHLPVQPIARSYSSVSRSSSAGKQCAYTRTVISCLA